MLVSDKTRQLSGRLVRRTARCARWTILVLLVPHIAVGDEGSYYALYRESEKRCLLISDTSRFKPRDVIYGGPFVVDEALRVVRERCPVPFLEETDWFAVHRDQGCWLVRDTVRLRPGDVVWDGNVSRPAAEAVVLRHCDDYRVDDDGAAVDEAVLPVAESTPEYQWMATSVPWVEVYAQPQAEVATTETRPPLPPPADWTALTPFVSVEARNVRSTPGAVRIELEDSLVRQAADMDKVALAFFEATWSQSGSATDARWRLHAVEHDPERGVITAELNHASVIGLVLIGGGLISLGVAGAGIAYDEAVRKLMQKKASAHFVLHFKPAEIAASTVDFTLDKLEAAYRLLSSGGATGGLGLSYPTVPKKLDVYYMDLGDPGTYGGYRQGKTGARWIDLNLPKKVTGYNQNTLVATIAHELFHFVQFPYEGYSTLDHAWWDKAAGNEFPYGWLNEALSSWIELYAVKDPSFKVDGSYPLLNADVYARGLQGLKEAGQGYSAGLFVDFLVRRYGVEVVQDILDECARQVAAKAAADPYAALRRAVQRRSRVLKPGDRLFGDMDETWRVFSDEFILERPHSTALDNRANRTVPYTAPGARGLTVGEKVVQESWSATVVPLSLPPQASRAYRVVPATRDDEGNAVIECTAECSPAAAGGFELATLVYEYDQRGSFAYFPEKARLVARLDAKNPSASFILSLGKADRWTHLSFIPVGLGASAAASTKTEGAYTLSCALRTDEEIPDFGTAGVSTSAIESYYRALLQAVTVMRAKPGTRIAEACSGCETLHSSAVAQYAPLKDAMIGLKTQMDDIHEEWRPMTALTSRYYVNIETLHTQLADSDRATIRRFVEISTAINEANNACSFSPNEYIQLRYLFAKGSFPVYPSFVESQVRHGKEPPDGSSKLDKAFRLMRDDFARIAACREAMAFIKPYLAEKKAEVFRQVDELKAKCPALQ